MLIELTTAPIGRITGRESEEESLTLADAAATLEI
jgi:hypothetical protein